MLRVVTCLILLAVLAPRATLLLAPGPRELIADPHFRGGFRLIDPTPGQRKVYGVLPALSPNVSVQAPSWDFDQWSSRFPLTVGTPVVLASGLRGWTNQGKSLCLGSGGPAQPDLSIAILATTEYRGRARKSGEPWVHGLVEQTFDNPPSLAALTSARIYLQARLTRSELQRTEDYSQGLHAAQFQLFLMLQNRRRDSPGYGKLVWFGIPLYDDRSRFAREHKQQDTGGTEMFIFTPAGDLFCDRSAHDREWVTVDKELLPLFFEALDTAWKRGFLRESKEAADYQITGMNMGWEVPGLFDVEMQVRQLSLRVETRPDAISPASLPKKE